MVFLAALAWTIAIILSSLAILLVLSTALSAVRKVANYILDRECCDD